MLLSDIAKVSEGFEDSDIITTYDGKPAVRLDVYRVGDQTPNSVAQAVQARLENFRLQLPKGVDINIMNDKSITFNQRMELLLSNGFLGLVLVFFVLALFLDLRLAFWVAMGIPVSFLGSFLILGALGVSINMITMFAFLIALGIVVDDAIVVGENVYTLREQGMPPLQAAIRGTKEISGPVVFSVLTNIVAFVPMLYMPGVMGKVWFAMPIVVISVFSISLIESLFILPAHLAHMKQSANKGLSGLIQRGQKRVSNGLFFLHPPHLPSVAGQMLGLALPDHSIGAGHIDTKRRARGQRTVGLYSFAPRSVRLCLCHSGTALWIARGQHQGRTGQTAGRGRRGSLPKTAETGSARACTPKSAAPGGIFPAATW